MADADAPACSYPPRPKAAAAPAAPAPAAEAHKTAFATTSLAEVKDGRFVRTASVYRNKIEKGGEFPPAAGRYHLYVSLACPWVCIDTSATGTTDVLGRRIASLSSASLRDLRRLSP